MDDIEDRYGGWFDAPLSEDGINGARGTVQYFKGIVVDLILTSPLKRASQTAEILGKALSVSVEVNEYLKERNVYGLLSGENKGEAKKKYPELVEAYDKGEDVLGYESYEFFLKRVSKLIEKLSAREEKTIVCVTHGKMLAAIFEEFIGKKAKKFNDNCLAECDTESNGKLKFIRSEKIDF